jgi:hypothetical protein
VLVRHDERCPACKYSYYVWAWFAGGNWVCRCAGESCDAARGNLDIARYGFDLGLPVEVYAGRASSRFQQSDGQRKLTERVANGTCVHCVLLGTGQITRRGAVAIPLDWRPVIPTVQSSLFDAHHPSNPLPTFSMTAVVGEERDHIIQRRLHDAIAPNLSSEQAIFIRRHWVVPSCRAHNQERSQSLEPLPYLMHVFALFLAAKDLTIADNVAETQLFVDAVKSAHLALRMQVAALRSEEA